MNIESKEVRILVAKDLRVLNSYKEKENKRLKI